MRTKELQTRYSTIVDMRVEFSRWLSFVLPYYIPAIRVIGSGCSRKIFISDPRYLRPRSGLLPVTVLKLSPIFEPETRATKIN